MTLSFTQLHKHFAAEVSPVDLRQVHDKATLEQIQAGMDKYAVLVFRNQPFTNEEQLAFTQRFDGELHTKSATAAILGKNRFGYAGGLSDISNVGADGQIVGPNDRRRMSMATNQLWHTDASFQDPRGRYSMLSCKAIPPVRADTQFADMRAAYDALDDETKNMIAGLQAHHSVAYTKEILGFELSQQEKDELKGAVQPLVFTIPRSNRRSLYLAAHITSIVGWPVPRGRLLVRDLTEHATRPEFVYAHEWRVGDFVILDNRGTMHRGRPFDDSKYRRELIRTTTLDVPFSIAT
jgi:alpha-ketoglutarate-dependent 2,4-dichlorophenoxyacetate dioxygenase